MISGRFREEGRLVYAVEMSDGGAKKVRINFISANLEKQFWPLNKSMLRRERNINCLPIERIFRMKS